MESKLDKQHLQNVRIRVDPHQMVAIGFCIIRIYISNESVPLEYILINRVRSGCLLIIARILGSGIENNVES